MLSLVDSLRFKDIGIKTFFTEKEYCMQIYQEKTGVEILISEI